MLSEFFHEYASIVTDPAHTLSEITNTIVIDVIFLGCIWRPLRRRFNKDLDRRVQAEHEVLDAEHGITHPATPLTPAPATAVAPENAVTA